ncbi:hypothetical protein [Paraburkholderia tropica]|uniref:hypothetical protein n=1 Tax=Paraburkholderia tropica TaxID=92647 RepID=UPI002AB7C60B|nr:hypothetical protein [Paraburkholderia tropica]
MFNNRGENHDHDLYKSKTAGDRRHCVDRHRASLWADRIAGNETNAGRTTKSGGKSQNQQAFAGREFGSAERYGRQRSSVVAGTISLARIEIDGGTWFANILSIAPFPSFVRHVSASGINRPSVK